jgi:ankyrin repeat protein
MLLVEFKADVDVQDGMNNTALHYAVMQGNLKLLKVILAKFPRIDLSNFNG